MALYMHMFQSKKAELAMKLVEAMKLSLILLICSWWRCNAQVEWHLTDTFTLNASEGGFPVSRGSQGLNFYYYLSSWINASGHGYNPYSYLCFISADAHAFTLSICTNSQNIGDNFDYHTPIVWSANRQIPARGNLITLTLQADGDLVLKGNEDKAAVWRTGTANKGVVRMQLVQFPINLVLFDARNRVVWQSIDHPSDTLTAFQTLKAGMKLVSWASPYDPSLGKYMLVVGNGSVTLYTSSLPYWKFSSPVAQDNVISVSKLGFIMTHTTSIRDLDFEGDPILLCMPSNDQVNKTFLRLESNGMLHLYSLTTLKWIDLCHAPSHQSCDLPYQCGPYGICSTGGNCACPDPKYFAPLKPSDVRAGCKLIKQLPGCNRSAPKSSSIGMLAMHGHDYFSTSFSSPLPHISSEEDCKSTCLIDCSCSAAFWHVHSLSCFHVNYHIGSLQGSRNESLYRAYLKLQVHNA